MIKQNQIVAARGLLGWNQDDLARQSGVSLKSINQIEGGHQKPTSDTVTAIERAFERCGIEFLPDGVRQVRRNTSVLDGPNRLLRLLDEIEITLAGGPEKELLIDGGDLSITPDDIAGRFSRLRDGGTELRLLVRKAQTPLHPFENCRFIPGEYFTNQVLYLYGHNVAIHMREHPEIIIYRSPTFHAFFKNRFEWAWEQAGKQ